MGLVSQWEDYLGGFRFDLNGGTPTFSNWPIDSSPASINLKIIATGEHFGRTGVTGLSALAA